MKWQRSQNLTFCPAQVVHSNRSSKHIITSQGNKNMKVDEVLQSQMKKKDWYCGASVGFFVCLVFILVGGFLLLWRSFVTGDLDCCRSEVRYSGIASRSFFISLTTGGV